MADTKISALTAASAAALANELAINEAGASKKITLAQVADLLGVRTKVLQADEISDEPTNTTMGRVVGLDQAVGVGTWWFEYRCVYQSSVAGTGVKFGVNFNGTQTLFVVECTGSEATTTASTGAADQVHAAFGLRAGGGNRAPSTTVAIYGSISVDTVDADMMAIIKGVVKITVAGDLQLYFGSEATGSTQTIKAGSALRLTKVG